MGMIVAVLAVVVTAGQTGAKAAAKKALTDK